jgi:phosphotriesterase-related protein
VIETVLGPVEAESLGPVSMHEHLLSDGSALGIPDVVLDDPYLAATELRLAAGAWRASSPDVLAIRSGEEALLPAVVDPSVWGFGGPDPRLADVSRESGVAVVAGVGAYVPTTRPEWINELGEDGLYGLFLTALTKGLPGCDFKAGIVGMLSPGFPLDDGERQLLRAGARAAAKTGSAAIIRLDPRRRDGLDVLEVTTSAGLVPERVVFSNVDGYARDLEPLRELAHVPASPPRPMPSAPTPWSLCSPRATAAK